MIPDGCLLFYISGKNARVTIIYKVNLAWGGMSPRIMQTQHIIRGE